MGKKHFNAIGAILTIVGLVPWVLDWIGRLLSLSWLYDNIALFEIPGAKINWEFVYFIIWVVGGVVLAASNWDWMSLAVHKVTRHRRGDLAANAALVHMAAVVSSVVV
jgi:hypothetical protein